MNDLTDQQLLEDYSEHGAESAFNELVLRHTDLVYSTALRLVVDSHLAEDVSQRVFVALAQNARKLSSRVTLGGWLHWTTHNFSVMTIRTEERRRVREQKVLPMFESPDSNNSWDQIAPHLDAALSELKEQDRDVVVLRFFERKTAREIGQSLGLSEEAAQKRVKRAMEKLHDVFRSRGVVLPAGVVAATILAQAVHGAPTGMAMSFSAKALADAATSISFAASNGNVLNTMAQIKAHPVAAAVLFVACLSLGPVGFVTGKKASQWHHAAEVWQHAVVASLPEPTATAGSPETESRAERLLAPNVPLRSVAEILAEAANYFRSESTDPDAWVKGLVALEKLGPGDAIQALQQLELYRTEPRVFNRMGPTLLGMWAETDPAAAIQYALANFQSGTLSMSLQRISQSWAHREPAAVWTWYREAADSGKLPEAPGVWQWPIFSEWLQRDPAGAFDQLTQVSLADERAAIFGISTAVKQSVNPAAILADIGRISDEGQRRRVAEAVARDWAELDPQSALQWILGLEFQNPAARSIVMRQALSRWSQFDPHAAAVWAVTQAPNELLGMLRPDQLEKVTKAAQ